MIKTENKKLFFAFSANDTLRELFLPVLKKIKINADRKQLAVKWVPLENLHVTITFLGDQPESAIPKLSEILERICLQFAPFDIKVEDVGAFPSEYEARVLWLGIQYKRYLAELKTSLDNELHKEGFIFEVQGREFVPHLTFGRLRNLKSVKDMISPFKRKSFGKINVDEVILFESKLQGAFPVYNPLLRRKLTGVIKTESLDYN